MPPASLRLSDTHPLPATRNALKPPTLAELARKVQAKLYEKFELTKIRHKPLSILRQEARRFLEPLLELEGTFFTKPDRDKLLEDLLAQSIGFCVIEELFRDESLKEILVLDPKQIIAYKNDNWTPTSTKFRDADHYRACLQHWREIGQDLTNTAPLTGAFDVRLPNNFRMVGVFPPAVMEQSPQVVFSRLEVEAPIPLKPASGIVATPQPVSPSANVITTPGPLGTRSGLQQTPRTATTPNPGGNPAAVTRVLPAPDLGNPDPYSWLKQRVATWLVKRCSAAGVFDLGQIPPQELQKVLQAQLEEISQAEHLQLERVMIDRLVLEILVSLKR